MKKLVILIAFLTLILLLFGCFSNPRYNLYASGELGKNDFVAPGGERQFYEDYVDNETNKYIHVKVMEFADSESAQDGITKLDAVYNPAQIILGKKYVRYKEMEPENPQQVLIYYASANRVIWIDGQYYKQCDDCNPSIHAFVDWYTSKYLPN